MIGALAPGMVRPAERAEANRRSSSTGTPRSARIAAHDAADLAGCSNDSDVACDSTVPSASGAVAQRVSLSRPKRGACRTCTASSTFSSGTTHEMRIAEVEIISMLMSLRASVSNTVAATPGLDLIPAPTRLTRPMPESEMTPAAPMSPMCASATSRATSRSP